MSDQKVYHYMKDRISFCSGVSLEQRKSVEDFLNRWYDENESLKIKTSGSTGRPKIITIEKEAMVMSARATGQFFNFKKDQINVLALSANYIAGIMQIVRSIVFEMKLLVVPVKSNPLVDLSGHRYDFAAFVPMQVQAILANNETRKIYESIANVIIGGAPVSVELERQIMALKNHSYSTFGMTETISHVALRKISSNIDLYQALPNIFFEKDDRDCLIIKTGFTQDKIVTNDRVVLVDETSFKWLGRIDFVINSGGVKLQPEVIENKLYSYIKKPFYISKQKDLKLGEKVVLWIESEGYTPQKYKELIDKLKTLLDSYEVPREVLFEVKFERTGTGKIIRK